MKKIYLTETQAEYINRILNEDGNNNKSNKPRYSYKDKLRLIKDKNIKDGGNFPIERNGRLYWVSRSNVVSLYVFCKDSNGEWCILASKRGPKNPTCANSWNVVGGFLDYGYSLEDTCVEECWEETGVKISSSDLRYEETFSGRKYSEVVSRYHAILQGVTDDYPTSIANCEPGEVSDAAWIPLSQVPNVKWMGHQKEGILTRAEQLLNDNNLNGGDDYTNLMQSLKNLVSKQIITVEKYNTIINILNTSEEL